MFIIPFTNLRFSNYQNIEKKLIYYKNMYGKIIIYIIVWQHLSDILIYQMFFEIIFKGSYRLIASYLFWDEIPYLRTSYF